MTQRFMAVVGTAVMVLALSTRLFAAGDEQLVLSDGTGDMVTIGVGDTGVVTITCNSGNCGQITQANYHAGLFDINSTGADGTISITSANFGGATGAAYNVSDTAKGQASSTLPTLMDFNQIDAQSASGSGSLTSTFTDTDYTDLSTLINVADSNVTDTAISASTITFTVLTDATQIYTNSLTGESDSNGAGGAVVSNPNSPDGSLTAQAALSFTGKGSIQANVSISDVAVPEPASIVFLGTMMLGFTVLIRKRQEKRS